MPVKEIKPTICYLLSYFLSFSFPSSGWSNHVILPNLFKNLRGEHSNLMTNSISRNSRMSWASCSELVVSRKRRLRSWRSSSSDNDTQVPWTILFIPHFLGTFLGMAFSLPSIGMLPLISWFTWTHFAVSSHSKVCSYFPNLCQIPLIIILYRTDDCYIIFIFMSNYIILVLGEEYKLQEDRDLSAFIQYCLSKCLATFWCGVGAP